MPDYQSKDGKLYAISKNGTEVVLQIKGINWWAKALVFTQQGDGLMYCMLQQVRHGDQAGHPVWSVGKLQQRHYCGTKLLR